ncbi:MAG: hypothetical protein J0H15_04535 [Xanthomonadales bacterium]|nr:hypothetical protein [Xanthomonadales bacterium]
MPNSRPLVIRRYDLVRRRRIQIALALVWLASLVLVGGLAAILGGGEAAVGAEGEGGVALRADNETLKRQVATLERSEQVARAALAEVQQNLRERDEELEALRADLAFYSRLVGGSQREGLAVHALKLTPVKDSRAWNFTATLTQNFRRGQDVKGRLTLSLEGVSNGQLASFGWDELVQAPARSGIEYAFKYFQRVSGTIMLPPGFAPNRVIARAEGDGGRAEQEFSWEDAVKYEEGGDVSK